MARALPAALVLGLIAAAAPAPAVPEPATPAPAPAELRAALDLPAGWVSFQDSVAVEIRLPGVPGSADAVCRFNVARPLESRVQLTLPASVLRLPVGTTFLVVLSPGRDPVRRAFRLEAGDPGPRALPVPAPDILEVTGAVAYPNPFNPLTDDVTLSFSLSEDAEITVEVFDWNGDTVGTVFRGSGAAGINVVRWSGQAEDGRRLANGVYLVRIEAATGTRREPVVLRVALWNE